MTDLRDIERKSIREFVQWVADAGYLSGRVLDYGCGRAPYRDIVESAGGTWVGFDRPEFPASVAPEPVGGSDVLLGAYEAVLTTQTIQYWVDVADELSFLRTRINDGGALVITGPTNWPWVEQDDRRRYTPTEIESLLFQARFKQVTVMERPSYRCNGISWLLGWGAVAVTT